MRHPAIVAALLCAALSSPALAAPQGNPGPTQPGIPSGPSIPKPAGAVDAICSSSFTRTKLYVVPPAGYTCKSPLLLCIPTYEAQNQKWDAAQKKFTYDCAPPPEVPK